MTVRLPIVDTHVHLWNLRHPTLRWDWLAPEAVHPILGDIDAIKSTAYEAEALWAEARFADVSHFVHIQAAIGSDDPVEETRWLTAMAERTGIPHALIAYVDLAAADADHALESHAVAPGLRGIRDFGAERYLASQTTDSRYEASLRSLARRELVFDLDCEWPNMAAAADLARRHPDLTIVLEHIGYPRRRDDEYFALWAAGINALAEADNIFCKISGLGMTDRLFTQQSLSPWIAHCLDAFDVERCLIGSNWPVDRICSSYDVIMNIYRDMLGSLSIDEQARVLAGNARAVYRLTGGGLLARPGPAITPSSASAVTRSSV